MTARDKITTQQVLENATAHLTIQDIMGAGIDEKTVTADLKRLASLGQLECIAARGRRKASYMLIAKPVKSIPPPVYDPRSVAFQRSDDTKIEPGDDVQTQAVKLAVHNHNRANHEADAASGLAAQLEQERERADRAEASARIRAANYSELLGERNALAGFLSAVGDALGSEASEPASLAGMVRDLVAERDQLVAGMNNLQGALRIKTDALAAAEEKASTLTTELTASMRQVDELREKGFAATAGYVTTAPKRAPRRSTTAEKAQATAARAVRAGAKRAEVFALVPVGRAVRGAEWRQK